MVNTQLTQKQIFEKDFTKSMRGYNPEEVDEFLDIIMQDYKTFDDHIQSLQTDIQQLRVQLAEAKDASVSTQAPPPPSSQQSVATNIDILKRISNLEQHVFGEKIAYDNEA